MGGKSADMGGKKNLKFYCLVPAIATSLCVPIQMMAFIVPSALTSLLIFIPSILLLSKWIAPLQATIQSVAPAHIRATASAMTLVMLSLIGFGLGPLTLGLLSDVLSGQLALGPKEGLRWALIIITLVALLSAAAFAKASPTIEQDIEG